MGWAVDWIGSDLGRGRRGLEQKRQDRAWAISTLSTCVCLSARAKALREEVALKSCLASCIEESCVTGLKLEVLNRDLEESKPHEELRKREKLTYNRKPRGRTAQCWARRSRRSCSTSSLCEWWWW